MTQEQQPRRRRRNRILRTLFTLVVVGVVGYFFARSLASNWDRLREQELSFGWELVLPTALFAAAVVVSGWLWGRMTAHLAKVPVPVAEAVRVHCLSWLLKYVPGQVGSAVNKVAWASSRGLSRTLVLITFVYENAFLLIGSLVPPMLVLLVTGAVDLSGSGSASTWLLAALSALVPLIALTSRPVFSRLTNVLARRVLKRSEVPHEYFLSGGQAFWYQVQFLLPRIVNGAGLAIIAAVVVDAPADTWVPLACAYIVAGAVGILAVFVPSGIGVREAVLVLLATPYLPAEQAIVIALVARLLATLADGLVAGLYGILTLGIRTKERDT